MSQRVCRGMVLTRRGRTSCPLAASSGTELPLAATTRMYPLFSQTLLTARVRKILNMRYKGGQSVTERLLTTVVGSYPQPEWLVDREALLRQMTTHCFTRSLNCAIICT